MTAQETNVSNSYESTLSSSLAIGATTVNVTTTSGTPAVNFYVVIDPDDDAKREVCLATAKTATSLTVTRAQDGTSDVAHDSGAVIGVYPVAALWTDINDRVDANNTLITSGDAPGHTHNAAYAAAGFHAQRLSTQALAAGTWTKLDYTTEVRDDGNDYDATTSEWAVPESHWYAITAVADMVSLADGNLYGIAIAVGGTRTYNGMIATSGAASGTSHSAFVSTVAYLAAGDVVSIQGYRSSAGNVGGTANSNYFSAVKV